MTFISIQKRKMITKKVFLDVWRTLTATNVNANILRHLLDFASRILLQEGLCPIGPQHRQTKVVLP